MDERHFEILINEQNSRGIPDFEGYSPDDMSHILYDPFGEDSPILLMKMSDSDYKRIPILNQMKYLSELIDKQGEMKLTPKGNLPLKIVAEIYSQGFFRERLIERMINKRFKESDSVTISLAKILLIISGIIKKRNNKLSLTKKGEKILTDDNKLLRKTISIFGLKFNWSYFDLYENRLIGQLGFGFSLILLGKYGNEKRVDNFYAEKYFRAFPVLIDGSFRPSFGTPESYAAHCYSLRTFDRFMDFFGLINIERERRWDADQYISKTELFDKLIKCIPHNALTHGTCRYES